MGTGFTEGCASNYEETECRCIGGVILTHYSMDETAETLKDGTEQGTAALLAPHQAEANGCFGSGAHPPAGAPTVDPTFYQCLRAC